MNYINSLQIAEGDYRYALRRVWDLKKPKLTCILLNPSKADNKQDDLTVKKLVAIASNHNFGAIEIVNLFAYRASNPKDLYQVDDPVGPKNDKYINSITQNERAILIAWGNHGKLNNRDEEILKKLENPFCLGINKNGTPKHPSHLANNTSLQFFK